MHPKDVSDPQQGRDAGIYGTDLDILVGLATHMGGEEHVLLGAVLTQAFDADAVADGASAFLQPGVVLGELGHSLDIRCLMIARQPGIPGIL